MRLLAHVTEHGTAIILVEGPGFAGLTLDGYGLFAARQRSVATLAQVLTRAHLFGNEVHVVGMAEGVRPAHVCGAPRSEPGATRDGDAAQVRVVCKLQIGRVQQRREFADLHVKFAEQQRSAGARTLRRNRERVRAGLSRAARAALEERESLGDLELFEGFEI